MGVIMGLASAALFGLNAVFVKIGMRRRPIDNGHFMSVLVNVFFIGVLMLFVTLPAWSWAGFAAFVLAGLMTTWVGRGTSFMAIRLLGPARQGAILVSAPLFAAITGWFFLDEGITLLQALGGVVISIGILLLMRARAPQQQDSPIGDSEVADLAALSGVETVMTRTARLRTAIRHDDFTRGFMVAILAALFFGSGFVARKWGLSYLPSAVGGAFFGACTALSMITLSAAARGRFRDLVNDNLRKIPWWFVGGGTAASLALLLQFSAFDYLPAWAVSLLQGTQAVWTLMWTWLFLRHEERIGKELVISIGFVVCGVTIMTLGL